MSIHITRRSAILMSAVAALMGRAVLPSRAADVMKPEDVIIAWYKLVLELVRHTPTYSPPVASRSFAYVGVAIYEAVASGSPSFKSLAGQLNDLKPVAPREMGQAYDEPVILNAVMTSAVQNFFGNTGPTGQHVMERFSAKYRDAVRAGVEPDIVVRSEAYGETVMAHILAWSANDGGAKIENMGFPFEYELIKGPGHWVPTSTIGQQQFPLLPDWGNNRSFAMPNGKACPLPPPPAYSEDKNSEFYKQALEVYETRKSLTPEQKTIARFWSDDPMLSPTPPGHWMWIAINLLEAEKANAARTADVLVRLGIAVADGFIGCWAAKFEYDLVRPVTYIKKLIDPKWESLLITPPFPEYPSGHSTQSGAAAAVMTQLFGGNFAFVDSTHARDGIKPRSFANFWAAAEEAAVSRLYGGIHFRAAIERGLEQGRCIGGHVNALHTRT
jgi:membrane-associated phospholipid phosphatase